VGAHVATRDAASSTPVADRVWTVPNVLSATRLIGVPVFCWLLLGADHAWGDWAALGVLGYSGVSDWLDGKLARALRQTSRLGQLLDPAADRLYIVATLVTFTVRDIVPIVLTVVLLAREAALAGLLPVLRRHGYGPLPVHYLGKAATLGLLYAFPLRLLGVRGGAGVDDVARVLGWAFTVWGTCMYWFAGVLYAVQVRRLVRGDEPGQQPPRGERPDAPREALA
jgi:cardiolipin synthase